MTDSYSHLIEISEVTRHLTIHRVYADGRSELFTSVALPDKTATEDEVAFNGFCLLLGENLLLDAPVARKLLGL